MRDRPRIPSSKELLNPIDVYLIDPSRHLHCISGIPDDMFLPPVPGIYIHGYLKPLASISTDLFIINPETIKTYSPVDGLINIQPMIPVTHTDVLNGKYNVDILDKDCNCLIRSNQIPLLTNAPDTTALRKLLILSVAQEFLYNRQYKSQHTWRHPVEKLMDDRWVIASHNDDTCGFDPHNLLEDLLNEIDDIPIEYPFSMFNIVNHCGIIQVQRLGDWRVYEWTLEQELKYEI